jgi:hypothetical protein
MTLVDKMDDIGKPAWIALMVGGFILFWPVGLATLAYLAWSGRMGCWKQEWRRERWGRWHQHGGDQASRGERWSHFYRGPSSGNRAFDEYRVQTLRRLEEEQREFMEFLDRLRMAKDKAEFDQFLAERRRPGNGEPQPQS